MSNFGEALGKQEPVDETGFDGERIKAGYEITGNDGTFQSPSMRIPIGANWDALLESFSLDPEIFEVLDDTVRMSQWQSSKRLENGERDIVTLYSYRGRFRRKAAAVLEDAAEAAALRIAKWKPIRKTLGRGLGVPTTQYVGWADWQIGKEGTLGSGGSIERVLESFDATRQRIKELRKMGRNVERLAIANMGDPMEGCNGQYAAQLFSVEMTQREQLNAVIDLWCQGLRHLAPMFDEVKFISVLSNHGEWSRPGPGLRAVTSDSDSADGFLAEAVKRVLDGREDTGHIRWVIPHSAMTMMTDMSGVQVALNHGHKAPGSAKELEWLRGQSLRMLRTFGHEPELWLTAHRHHVDVKDYGPWWRLQHPTLDHGSKWFEDTTGMWSTPGTLTMLIGQHEQAGDRRFSDMQVV